jgi:hypothetical protein
MGLYKQQGYAHIIPKRIWEESLWEGIRQGLPVYLKQKRVQPHTGVNNLLSSWVQCANLYFPIRSNQTLKTLMAEFLRQKVSDQIIEIEEVELEFAFDAKDELNPSTLLGETDGSRGANQTSPDVAFLVKTKDGQGIVLTECKYTEKSFYKCSALTTKGSSRREGNPNPKRCFELASKANYKKTCHQTVWGRKYWDHLNLSSKGKQILIHCPAANGGYQLFRQQALAEGIMQSGKFSLVATSVAFDSRNDTLKNSLKRTGIADFQTDWGNIFDGKATFKTWTHQEWVQFVRANQQNGQFNHWLGYLEGRYGY